MGEKTTYLFQVGAGYPATTDGLDPAMPLVVADYSISPRTLGLVARIRAKDAVDSAEVLAKPDWKFDPVVAVFSPGARQPRVGDLMLETNAAGAGLFVFGYDGWWTFRPAELDPRASTLSSLLNWGRGQQQHSQPQPLRKDSYER